MQYLYVSSLDSQLTHGKHCHSKYKVIIARYEVVPRSVVQGGVINDPPVYTEFSSGKIDGSLPVPDEYLGTVVKAFEGAKKTELTRVNCEYTEV